MEFCSIETKHSSFDDDKKVHPWNKIVDQLCQEIAPEDMERLIFIAKPQLGDRNYKKIMDSKDYLSFFNTLEDRFKDDTPDVVIHLLEAIDLHNDTGSRSFAYLIKEYKCQKKKYDMTNNQIKNENFVGRKNLLERTINCLENDKKIKGVILCGMSGIGKTALANEICNSLKSQRPMLPRWKILWITELEKTDICDLYSDLMFRLLETFLPGLRKIDVGVDVQEMRLQLKAVFSEVMAENKQKTVIYIDNVDGHCSDIQRSKEFETFVYTVLECIQSVERSVKVRLLITVRQKLVGSKELLKSENVCFRGHMLQQEVQPLDDADATALLQKISGLSEMELSDEKCSKINTSVGGNSMILKHIAMNLRFATGSRQMSCDKMLAQLFDPRSEMSTKINLCLENSIHMFDTSADHQTAALRQVLVNLSLFKTAWFTFEDAMKVAIKLEEESWAVKYNKGYAKETMMILSLLTLKDQHLIEIDKFMAPEGNSSEIPLTERLKSYNYALHPLVFQYIDAKCDAGKGLAERVLTERREARLRYLKHFITLIDKWGKDCNAQPHTTQALLERNKVHCRHFFEYFIQDTFSLTEIFDPKDKVYRKFKSLWKMVEIVQSAGMKINFAKRLSSEAEREKHLFKYVYWKCKEVEFLLSVGKTDLAVYTFTDMSNNLQFVNMHDLKEIEKSVRQLQWKQDESQTSPMLACLFETKGCVLKAEKTDNPQVLSCLDCAEKLYKRSNRYNEDRARVLNLIGCYYFDIGEQENSKSFHTQAYKKLQKTSSTYKHPDSSVYLTNIAACVHQSAEKITDNEDAKKKLLHNALEKYTVCVDYNIEMKRDMLQNHAMTLMNRAEVNFMLKKQEQAMKDAAKSLHILKSFYSMPHARKTIAYGQNAYFAYKFGKNLSNKDERKERLRKAVFLYDDALSEIMHGGLPLDHKEFKSIKDFHIKAMKALGMAEKDVEQRCRRYADFVLGKYDDKINKIKRSQPGKSIDAALQELEAKGAVGIILPGTSYADDIEEPMEQNSRQEPFSDSSKDADSTSSEAGTSDEEAKALDAVIKQTIQRQRHDSGVDSDEDNQSGVPMNQSVQRSEEYHMKAGRASHTHTFKDELPDNLDNQTAVTDSSLIHREEAPVKLKRVLRRQDSLDLDMSFPIDPVPSTSLVRMDESMDHEAVTMRPRKRRKSSIDTGDMGRYRLSSLTSISSMNSIDAGIMERNRLSSLNSISSMNSVDTGFGEGNRLSSLTDRSSMSSVGSQDSVTSQLGKRLTLHKQISIHEEEGQVDMTKDESKQTDVNQHL